MRSQLDSSAQIKFMGSSGWTLRTKTNQLCLLKLLTLAEQIFQEEPKGFTDMDTLTLGQQVQHIPCAHSSHSWPSPWLWGSTNSQMPKVAILSSVPSIPRTFNTSFSFSLEKSQFLLCIRRTFSLQEWDHVPA